MRERDDRERCLGRRAGNFCVSLRMIKARVAQVGRIH
jgi:hypothetical protein